MASSNIVANDVVTRYCRFYGNNSAHTKVSTEVPSMPGYKPIGIIGFYPEGGYDVGENISQLNINGNYVDCIWSTAIPTSHSLVVTVLYAQQ